MVANRVDTGPREIRLDYHTVLEWRQQAKEEYKPLLSKKERSEGWSIETIPLRVWEEDAVDTDKMRLLEEVSLYRPSTGHSHFYGVFAVASGWNPYRGGYKPGCGKPRGEAKIGANPFNFRITEGQDHIIQLLAKKISAIKRKNRSERFRYFVELGIDRIIHEEAYRDVGRAPIGSSIPTVEGVRLTTDYHTAAIALKHSVAQALELDKDLSDYKIIQLSLQLGLESEVSRLGIVLSGDETTDIFF